MDRLITELKLTPGEAFTHLSMAHAVNGGSHRDSVGVGDVAALLADLVVDQGMMEAEA